MSNINDEPRRMNFQAEALKGQAPVSDAKPATNDTSATSNGSVSSRSLAPPAATNAIDAAKISATNAIRGSSSFKSCSIVEDIQLPLNVSRAAGRAFTIHVVPDTRFATYVFTEYALRAYNHLEFGGCPLVTPTMLVGYMLYIVHAFVLHCDISRRSIMSSYASQAAASHSVRKILTEALNCHVPDVVLNVCRALRPHTLEVRSNIKFVSSYGTCMFKYDAGRLVPPSIFLQAHDSLISRIEYASAYKEWTFSSHLKYNDTNYKVANFIGSLYQRTEDQETLTFRSDNWLSKSVIRLANSATHRRHLQHRMISECNYTVQEVTDESYNPYTFLLMLDPENRNMARNFLSSMSDFCRRNLPEFGTIDGILNKSSGDVTRHMITGADAPTWNRKAFKNLSFDTATFSGSFKGFCNAIEFGRPNSFSCPSTAFRLPDAGHSIEDALYLVSKTPGGSSSLAPAVIEEETCVDTDVLLYDPYEDEPSAHYFTLFSGKIISNGNVDGLSFPLSNPAVSVKQSNSRIHFGAICAKTIVPEFGDRNTPLYPRVPRYKGVSRSLALLYDYASV